MKSFKYTIKTEVGVHVKPAGQLSAAAEKYMSKIFITKGDASADATKLLAVMSLKLVKGDKITVNVIGEDEEHAVEGIKTFIKENF